VDRFLDAAVQDADATLGPIAPRGAELTLRGLAANAVMSGCLPEYMPVLEAAVVAMQQPDFNLYGVQMTTHPCALMVVAQGPIAGELGISAGAGCMGAGHRANGTIGRAIRLVAMNIGGARPGEGEVAGDIDRATQGTPAKWSFCFAENQADSPWPSFASELFGDADDADNVVTVAAVEGPHNINDHQSTSGENLLKTIAATMATPGANTAYRGGDQYLAIGPEHARVFREAGWSKQRLRDRLLDLLTTPAEDLAPGADGIDEGTLGPPEPRRKFRDDGLLLVHAGGPAGLFSAAIGGWGGTGGSLPVTQEVRM
jgi:hypothetical protein